MRPFAVLNSPSESPSVDDAPILHVDLDAFFASVEILDDPTLRGKPVAVGGGGARGVVASASYEARRYGVRSAMPSVIARRRCPDLIILPGRFDRYEEYSRRFHDIVRDLTPDFEPLGLDEVFANLSSLRRLHVRPAGGRGRTAPTDHGRARSALRGGTRAQQALRQAGLQGVQADRRRRATRRGRRRRLGQSRARGAVAGGTSGARALGRRSGDRGEAAEARSAMGARPGQGGRGDVGRPRRGGDGLDPRGLRPRRGQARGDGRSGPQVGRSRPDVRQIAERPRGDRRGGEDPGGGRRPGAARSDVASRARSRSSSDSTTSRASAVHRRCPSASTTRSRSWRSPRRCCNPSTWRTRFVCWPSTRPRSSNATTTTCN